MTAKTQFSENDLMTMLTPYNLGQYEKVQPIAAGTVQTNYVVQTSRGAYVLKYYDSRSIESVRFETSVLTYIHKSDFPCAPVIKNKRGSAVSVFRDKPYVLYDFVQGERVESLNAKQLRQVIHTAARLQRITQGYRPRMTPFRWNYNPQRCLKLAREAAQKLATEASDAKLRWFEQQLAILQLPQSLPKGICHTDYDLSNLLFAGDELVALLDFDDANYTYLLFDLASLVDGYGWEFGKDFDIHAAREIVQNYNAARPLGTVEKRHLFDVHKLGILFDGIWYFARGTADDFYEKHKIDYLDSIGRETYCERLFGSV